MKANFWDDDDMAGERAAERAAERDTPIERELERERHERALHDEQRASLATDDEFRLKDAREHAGTVGLKRPH
jgi:hypothetical protein